MGAAETISRIEADSAEESESQGSRRYIALQRAEEAFLVITRPLCIHENFLCVHETSPHGGSPCMRGLETKVAFLSWFKGHVPLYMQDSVVEPHCSPKEPLAEIMSAVMHGAPAATLMAPEEMLLKSVETLQAADDKDQVNACTRESTGLSSSCIFDSAALGLGALPSVRCSTAEHAMAMQELAAGLNCVAEEGRRGLEGATFTQDLVTTWWEQPALDATPWVGVDAATRGLALMPGVTFGTSEDGFQPEDTRSGRRTARGWQSHVWSLIG